MSELSELESADAYCRHLTSRHYENFSVISVFLPKPMRKHLARIYGFCRTTDDFGDESEGRGPARLEQWRKEVEVCFEEHSAPIHPVLIALKETIREFSFEPQVFLDLIGANVQDQSVSSYETWEDLRAYCMLSAAPVGRMVLRVFERDNDRTIALSDDVCIGLQLANHAQDVKRDSARNRSYLLQSVVRESGITAAVHDLVDRAENLLGSGVELEQSVPRGLRAQLALYRLGGMEVVNSIRRIGYRTDEVRPTVSTQRKLRLAMQAARESVS